MQPFATFLRQTALFVDLDDNELGAVGDLCRQRTVPKGSIVFYEEDPGTSCYMLCEGRIKIVVNSQDGREHILGILKPGDLFGEMSLLDGQPRSATAIAVEEAKVLVLQRDEFTNLVKANPSIALKLLVVLTRRLRQTDRHVESLAFLSAPGRVARLLLDLGKELGQSTPAGVSFETSMTRQEMANLTGTSRET
ncbi:MAG: Crp/Fnr family transcriptional regulator, partial [Cyanobacteria bacterium REEB65]|nr:Crp/Fnr family transcriptional regulator [Cyanobacteria bacterium REEB65]